MTLTPATKRRLRYAIYLGGFFLNASSALTAYINSSFLNQFAPEKFVGIFYVAASIVSLISAIALTELVHRYGPRKILAGLSAIVAGLLFTLTLTSSALISILALLAYLVTSYLLAITLDIQLEQLSTHAITGRIRGLFLTLVNLAWLLSPLLATYLVGKSGFSSVYLISFAALLPLLIWATTATKTKNPRHERFTLLKTLRRISFGKTAKASALRRILVVDLALNFFYATMVIYTPIFLNRVIGFDWLTIGKIFTIMLLPFVLIDFVLGQIADTTLGEKELLLIGLGIAGVSTGSLAFLTTDSAFVWAIMLFATRVGAATIEMMKESYLFKQIDGGDINTIFLSRATYPLAYVIAPVLATTALLVMPLQNIYFGLGLILLAMIPVASKLKDTR